MRFVLGTVVLLVWAGLAWAESSTLVQQQEQARQQQTQLQKQIRALQKDIDSQESSRRDAAYALKTSESLISDINARLLDLEAKTKSAHQDLASLKSQTQQEQQQLSQRQTELADQLRAQYASGLSPWAALLSGADPRTIGRDLAYLGYVSAAQAQAVRQVHAGIERLNALHKKNLDQEQALTVLVQETKQQKQALQDQQAERKKVLSSIEAQLQQQRGQAGQLAQNDTRLGKVISGLEAAIAKQAEEARIAEEKRKAEAARRAEQARAVEHVKQRVAAEKARADAERLSKANQGRAIDQGLSKGMAYPVRGDVLGRFGAERPDGGVWRGVVLRSPEGTPVHVISGGRVAYASWLAGFGNIIIVDHGQAYLSVYAHNQSLLKQVGDTVSAGDTIATVGATGGQVDAGLYFEIRHNGVPVNPLLWLKP